MPQDEPQALILEPGSPKPDAKIGRLLAAHLDIYAADAIASVRYGGGILVRSAPSHTLASLVDGLRELDVRSHRVSSRLLEDPPRSSRATRIDFRENVMWIQLPNRRELAIRQEDVRGIQLHALDVGSGPPESEGSRKPRGGSKSPVADPASVRQQARRLAEVVVDAGAHETTDRCRRLLEWSRATGRPLPRLVITLYVRDPIGPVRLEREDLDYSVLGERKLPHSLDNFLSLLEWILSRLPGLRNRDRVEAFLRDLDPEDILVFKAEEVQNFDQWMQAWIRTEEPGELIPPFASPGPENEDSDEAPTADRHPEDGDEDRENRR